MKYQFYDWDDTIVTSKEALYLSYKKALEEWHLTFDFDYFNDLIYNDSGKYLTELCNFSAEEIAEVKMSDLNCFTLESAMRMVAGTARSMGITITGDSPFN